LEAALKGVFNRVLTKLVISGYKIGDGGKQAMRDTVNNRSGFVLEL